MPIKYYSTAWNDIKHSDGWFGKLCLLALIGLIPIFGQIVVYGYLYGWAREVAWGVRAPMPARIFDNSDGKFYRRGGFIFLASIVLSLVPIALSTVGAVMESVGAYSFDARGAAFNSAMTLVMVGNVIALIGSLLAVFVEILVWVSSMRISIYDNLSSGLQLKVIWKMIKYDASGIMRIFGMYLLVGLIIGTIASVIISIVTVVFLVGLFGAGATLNNGSTAEIMGLLLTAGGGFLLAMLVLVYATSVGGMFVSALVARAMGYWTCQFDVPRWRSQDEPMPFELVQQQPPMPTV